MKHYCKNTNKKTGCIIRLRCEHYASLLRDTMNREFAPSQSIIHSMYRTEGKKKACINFKPRTDA